MVIALFLSGTLVKAQERSNNEDQSDDSEGFVMPDINALLATQIVVQGDQDGDKSVSASEFAELGAKWYALLARNESDSLKQDDFGNRYLRIIDPKGDGGGLLRFLNPGVPLFLATDVNKNGIVRRDEFLGSFDGWFSVWSEGSTVGLSEAQILSGLNASVPKQDFGFLRRFGGRRRGEPSPDAGADFSAKPPILPVSPAAQTDSFVLQPGYRMELVLSDPHILEPGAIAFDGNGRMFVLEIRGYMQDADATGELDPVGRISLHEDRDNDGLYEHHSVFVDNLVFPRFVLPYGKNSVLTMESNEDEVWRFSDEDGDGVAEKKELFVAGYRRGGNVEHQQSFLTWALDNWLYCTVHSFRTRWDGSARQDTGSNGAQWGVTQDDYGKMFFQGGASGLPSYFQLPVAYGNFTVEDQIDPGMRIPYGVSGVWDFQPGLSAAKKDGSLRTVTGSAGNDVFRGHRLPQDLIGDYLYGEPVGRIVRRIKVDTTDGLTRMRNAYEEEKSEFIQSKDHLFRPVDMATAPDGTLYIVDMYRGIIQEGTWTPRGSYLRKKIEQYALEKVVKHGRIWRLTYDGIERDKRRPRMLQETPAELVKHLEHPNGWWRDTAQQLLVLGQDQSAVPALESMARESSNELARIHALWTLEGLGALKTTLVKDALKSSRPAIKRQAIRLSENIYQAGDTSLENTVRDLVSDEDADVAIQAILTLKHLNVSQIDNFVRTSIATTTSSAGVREIGTQLLRRQERNRGGRRRGGRRFSQAEQLVMKRGARVYQELCFACHGVEGTGTPLPDTDGATMAPSMVGSPRILGHRDFAINVVLHGLEGAVDGETYTAGMVPMGSNTDEWIADIISYIRNSFGNAASFVSPEDVVKVREASKGRNHPWNIEELIAATPTVLPYQKSWKVTASHNNRMAEFGINSAGNVSWNSGESQKPEMWFQLEMPEAPVVTEIALTTAGGGRFGRSPLGFPLAYEVRVSSDGQDWSEPVAQGEGSGSVTVASFPPVAAKYLRVIQTGSDEASPAWSIQKTKVYRK